MADEAPDSPPAAPSLPPPENQGKWVARSESTMMNARNLTRDMLRVVRKNDIAESENKEAAQEAGNREKEEKKSKVLAQAGQHEKVINTSFQCMQDIEDAILQTEESISKLTKERYRGYAFLQVCERRQELRQKRPQQENFKDNLADALSAERALLEKYRNDLVGLGEQGKQIVEELNGKRSYLSRDIGERRLKMAADLRTLNEELGVQPPESPKAKKANQTLLPEDAPADGNAPPPTPASPTAKEPPKELTPEERKAAEAASQALIKDTMNLLGKCANHRSKSMETILKAKVDTDRANLRTENCLSRKCTELADMKKSLEKHALDVDAAITTSERALDKTEKRLDKKDTKKIEKLAADKAMLKQLQEVRAKLGEDLRSKFAALEIDNLCRRVTAAKASEAKMKATMQRSMSAPGLRKGNQTPGSSPGTMGDTGMSMAASDESTRPPTTNKAQASPSPLGGSKSLKAGAAAGLAA